MRIIGHFATERNLLKAELYFVSILYLILSIGFSNMVLNCTTHTSDIKCHNTNESLHPLASHPK